MLHTFTCEKCEKPWYAACFEYLNYTEAGWEVRKRQMKAKLCPSCFGEVAELKPADQQQFIPVTVFGGKEDLQIVAAKTADDAAEAADI